MNESNDVNESYDESAHRGWCGRASGAVALARSRRSVLVVDAGEPRNRPAHHAHNFLTRDGTPPAALRGGVAPRSPGTAGASRPPASPR